jgi:hypothetical protein
MEYANSAHIAASGDLLVLQWARENDCSWNEKTSANAAWIGCYAVLEWAQTNSCPWNETTCANAALNGHLAILKWARNNGCPWDENTCTQALAKVVICRYYNMLVRMAVPLILEFVRWLQMYWYGLEATVALGIIGFVQLLPKRAIFTQALAKVVICRYYNMLVRMTVPLILEFVRWLQMYWNGLEATVALGIIGFVQLLPKRAVCMY